MKPEIMWPLWIKDSERFSRNPLKDEVKLRFALGGLGFILLVNVINFCWR